MNPLLEKVQSGIADKIKPEFEQDFLNAVKAGKKILFDPSTHQNMELIKNPQSRKDPVNTIAKGIAGLGMVMYQHSGKQIAMDVLIPALTMLMCEVFDFGEQAGWWQVSNEIVAATTKQLIAEICQKFGVSQQQLQEAVAKGKAEIDAHQTGQQAEPAPGGDPSAQPQPPAQPGMLPTATGA